MKSYSTDIYTLHSLICAQLNNTVYILYSLGAVLIFSMLESPVDTIKMKGQTVSNVCCISIQHPKCLHVVNLRYIKRPPLHLMTPTKRPKNTERDLVFKHLLFTKVYTKRLSVHISITSGAMHLENSKPFINTQYKNNYYKIKQMVNENMYPFCKIINI